MNRALPADLREAPCFIITVPAGAGRGQENELRIDPYLSRSLL